MKPWCADAGADCNRAEAEAADYVPTAPRLGSVRHSGLCGSAMPLLIIQQG